MVIEKKENNGGEIDEIQLNGKAHKSQFISHEALVNRDNLQIILK